MNNKLFFTFLVLVLFSSCKNYLDEIPDKKLAVPKKLQDLQLLLNNSLFYGSGPNTPEILSDDYFVTTASFNAVPDEKIRNLYLWKKEEHDSWDRMYKVVYQSNVVLDHLKVLSYDIKTEQESYDKIEGTARFFKALSYYWILQIYSLPYQKAGALPGIPLRQDSDLNVPNTRSEQQVCYDEVLANLKKAVDLLPAHTPVKVQPSKTAARALLARVYLTMGDFENAYRYADSCIRAFGLDNLLDFNNPVEVNVNANLPFGVMNKEVIFHASGSGNVIINSNHAKVNTELYKTYTERDIRKRAFFRSNTGAATGTYSFKGVYDQSANSIFYGLALDEIVLIRAECAARTGRIDMALKDINDLLSKRWEKGYYEQLTDTDPKVVLSFILNERRKSLLRRGLRWVDLRRLGKEGQGLYNPVRQLDGTDYVLDIKGNRMAVLIPFRVIELSGIIQND